MGFSKTIDPIRTRDLDANRKELGFGSQQKQKKFSIMLHAIPLLKYKLYRTNKTL